MNSRGNALVTVLIISAALLAVAGATMTFSRSDIMISENTTKTAEALWAAQAGSERAKFDLEDDYETIIVAPTPRSYSGTIGNATYASTLQLYPNATPPAKFVIDSTGSAPDMSQQRVREVVTVAKGIGDLDAINIHGVGSHTTMAANGNVRLQVPYYTIDGRNHDEHAEPYTLADNPVGCRHVVSSVSADTAGANNVLEEMNDLRCGLVKAANDYCPQNPPLPADCSPGLWWIRGNASTERFLDPPSNCSTSGYNFPDLDLSSTWLRNMASTDATSYETLVGTQDSLEPYEGPMTVETAPDTTGSPPFIRQLTTGPTGGLNTLNSQIQQILDFAVRAPTSQKICFPDPIPTSPVTLGTWTDPKIVVVPKGSHPDTKYLELRDQACGPGASGPANMVLDGSRNVSGTGILVLPRAMVLDGGTSANPTKFHWRGIVLVLDDGDVRLGTGSNAENVCGGILGSVIMKDDSGADGKLNFRAVGNTTCPSPWWIAGESAAEAWGDPSAETTNGFYVKYSCEAINRSFAGAPGVLAWIQRFEGE